MKPIALCGSPPSDAAPDSAKVAWLMKAMKEVILNSRVDAMQIADSYTVTGLPATPARTLAASSATLTTVIDVLGQFLSDLKTRGPNTGT